MSDSNPIPCSPAADLPLDLLHEVFLRLPPDPHNLLAASLVCRRWRRLVRCPAFLHRFRAFHRAPPVLGFFQNLRCASVPGCDNQRHRRLGFVPTVPFVLRRTPPDPDPDLILWALDCRRGRVLLRGSGDQGLHVWDPVAGEVHSLSTPPGSHGVHVAAAVVCAERHDDHADCHSTPFQIVFLDTCVRGEDEDGAARCLSASVYSSETNAWGDATVIPFPFPLIVDSSKRSALVGDSLYWALRLDKLLPSHIVEYNLSRKSLESIVLPHEIVTEAYRSDIHLMPAEDGGIGFAAVSHYYSLHFWSRRIGPEGAAEWELIRKVDLERLSGLPDRDSLWYSSVVAFAEDSDELFIQSVSRSQPGVFMLNIRSLQLRKVLQATGSPLYPYASFYTRGRDIAGIDDTDDQ